VERHHYSVSREIDLEVPTGDCAERQQHLPGRELSASHQRAEQLHECTVAEMRLYLLGEPR
jgi:hypothetical protein